MKFNIEEDSKKLLANPKWTQFLAGRKFTEEYKKEAILTSTPDAGTDAGAASTILSQVVEGLRGYQTLDWMYSQSVTTGNTVYFPVGKSGSAAALASTTFASIPLTTEFLPCALDQEVGVKTNWTRSFLEDASYDVLSVQNKEAGQGINMFLQKQAMNLIQAIPVANLAGGSLIAPITITTLKTLIKGTDVAGYGTADYVLCSPTAYWDILALEQISSALYLGPESLKTGVAPTTWGVTFAKCSALPTGSGAVAMHLVAVNSKNSVGIGWRRQLLVEPYELPATNDYGIVASVRCRPIILRSGSISIGTGSIS